MKTLDDDEAAFLDLVNSKQMQLNRSKQQEEQEAIAEYRVSPPIATHW